MSKKLGPILFSEEQILSRVNDLVKKISSEYDELITVTVLKGAKPFSEKLREGLNIPVTNVDIRVKSYEGTESSGKIKVISDVSMDISGKDVLIVEDIVDTGGTMDFLIRHFKEDKGANSVKVCSFLSKPSKRVIEIPIDFLGFEIEDRFVVGFGLDFNEEYRELGYICELVDN